MCEYCPVYKEALMGKGSVFVYIEPDITFDAILNGSRVGFASDQYGSQRIRYQPHVGKLKNPICQFPASLKSPADFLLLDAFSHM